MEHKVGNETLKNSWKHRAWESYSDIYLMNLYQDSGDSFFGDLTLYTEGFKQALLRNHVNGHMLPVEQMLPPEGKEYVHSIMYWMVIGDHVMVLQSRSLTTKKLEEYFTWFLGSQTKVMSGDKVILDAKFDWDPMSDDLDDIKQITIGGGGITADDSTHQVKRVEHETTQNVSVKQEKRWGKKAVELLSVVMSSEADVQKFLDNIPNEAELDVAVSIGYKAKKKDVSYEPMKHALRNMPYGEISTRSKYGTSQGKDIRLSYPARILEEGNLLNVEDVKEKLFSAYEYFRDNGKIS